MKRILTLIISVLLLASCVHLPMEQPNYNGKNAANVTFFRPKKFIGCAVGMYLKVDGNAVAYLKNGSHTTFLLEPGQHKFVAILDTWFGDAFLQPANFKIKANRSYYFKTNNSIGGVWYIFQINKVEASNLLNHTTYVYPGRK